MRTGQCEKFLFYTSHSRMLNNSPYLKVKRKLTFNLFGNISLWELRVLMGRQLKVKCDEDACIYEYVNRIADLNVGGLFQYLLRC